MTAEIRDKDLRYLFSAFSKVYVLTGDTQRNTSEIHKTRSSATTDRAG